MSQHSKLIKKDTNICFKEEAKSIDTESTCKAEAGLASQDAENLSITNATAKSLSSERPNKKFDFFYRRTVFRNMGEYYKDLFGPTMKKIKVIERTNVMQPESMTIETTETKIKLKQEIW